jgi:hypothetical protein
MLDFTRVDDSHRLKSSMRVISDSWPVTIFLGWYLPWSIVVEHEKWARLIRHLTTISWDILCYAKSISYHMSLPRMLFSDDFFLHGLMIVKI